MKLGMICSTKPSPHEPKSCLPLQIGGLLKGFRGSWEVLNWVPEGDVIVMVMGRDLGGEEVLVTPEQGGALQGREYRAGGRATHRAGNV